MLDRQRARWKIVFPDPLKILKGFWERGGNGAGDMEIKYVLKFPPSQIPTSIFSVPIHEAEALDSRKFTGVVRYEDAFICNGSSGNQYIIRTNGIALLLEVCTDGS